MKMLSLPAFALAGLLLPITVCEAAETDVLEAVPDNVLAAVVLPHPDQTQESLNKLAAELQLPIPNLVQLAVLQSGLQGGVDTAGPMAVVLDESTDGDPKSPALVYCVTAADFNGLVKRLNAETGNDGIAEAVVNGRSLLLAEKGEYLLVSVPEFRPALQNILQHDADDGDSLAAATSSLMTRRSQNDISLVMTSSGITWLQQRFLEGLAMMKTQIAAQQPDNHGAVAGLTLYEEIARDLHKQFSSGLVGLSLSDEGLRFVKSGVWTEKQETFGEAVGRETLLKDLAAGTSDPYVIALAGKIPGGVGDAMMDFSVRASTIYFQSMGSDKAYVEELQQFGRRMMKQIGQMSMVMGIPQSGQSLYGGTHFSMHTSQPEQFLEDYLQSIEMLEAATGKSDAVPISYTIERLTEQGHSIVALKTDMSGMVAQQQQVPGVAEAMKLFFGPDNTLMMYLAAAEDRVVGQYVSKEKLLQKLQPRQQQTVDPHLQTTAELLPEDASLVMFWSIDGTVTMVTQFLAQLQQPAPPVPVMQPGPPAGMSISVDAQRLDLDAVLPQSTILDIARFARNAQAANAR